MLQVLLKLLKDFTHSLRNKRISMTNKLISIFFLLCIIISSDSLVAQNQITQSEWEEAFEYYSRFCEEAPPLDTVNFFNDTFSKAKEIRSDFCDDFGSRQFNLQNRVLALLDDLRRLFPTNDKYISLKTLEHKRLEQSNNPQPAVLELEDDPILAIRIATDENTLRITDDLLSSCQKRADQLSSGSSCISALSEFKQIYNYAHGTISQPIAYQMFEKLEDLEEEWSNFIFESKAQTLLELWINGSIYKRNEENLQFKSPPNWQLVFLHPNIMIENVPEALDGQETKEAVMIEAIGINWWQQDLILLPTGISLIGLYSDRADLKDWRYGAALHFDSNISFGVTYGDNHYGIFGTIDLLKLLQDKNKVLRKYRRN